MPKLSDYKMPSENSKVDNNVTERIERMMEDSYFDFALEDLEKIWAYVQETGNIKDWMVLKLDVLEKYKDRQENK